ICGSHDVGCQEALSKCCQPNAVSSISSIAMGVFTIWLYCHGCFHNMGAQFSYLPGEHT
ncbi:Protein of unknown function, partial [Gryllus bimaculatus]